MTGGLLAPAKHSKSSPTCSITLKMRIFCLTVRPALMTG